jgi:hypothetical protein
MPLTQPKRDNPLMGRYFRLIGLPGKRLAERCGVFHSQVYMTRTRHAGADNAEKVSRGVAGILGLPEMARLELKAEIMGRPGDLMRAYLGDSLKASRLLGVPEYTAAEILDEEKTITHRSGVRALRKLKEMGAPAFVLESVERRMMPPPERPRGIVTYRKSGLAVRNDRGAAYRRLARAHHPDKVENEPPQVKEDSERRMKEINAAYSLLKRRGNGSAEGARAG